MTTADPVEFEGVRACHGPSKSGSWEVAKTRITSGYATLGAYRAAGLPQRVAWASPRSEAVSHLHLAVYAGVLALQAVTPARLAAEVPGVTLAEARKVIAQ